MGNVTFSWESLLSTDAPKGCSLKAALFTTYDRAEERFLAEHLLPFLLRLCREPGGEGAERQYFLLELDRRLKQLHDRLVVVSSTTREEPGESIEAESGTYGWIWRSIRQLTVGSRDKAVQHAKLWLLHWGAADDNGVEYLELVVSSANLTTAAFRGQLQGVWRACMELHPQRSEVRLGRWGILPEFLRELGNSAGDDTSMAPFVQLLARADCPGGVAFLASVPGTWSREKLRRTPWGDAGLREIIPRGRGTASVSILSPFVGSWNPESLRCWCARFEGSPDRLHLIWIDKNHPWAKWWIMPKSSLTALSAVGAALLHLRYEPDDDECTSLFHADHRPADNRWSHAKVYSFKRGKSCRLLLTSANFSQAAWGSQTRKGELTIENFELGVCVERGAWPFENLEAFEDEKCAATVSQLPSRGTGFIAWARASWNGKKVVIECRCDSSQDLQGQVKSSDGKGTPIGNWTVGADTRLRSARVQWVDKKQPPSVAHLTCKNGTLSVAVFDERPPIDREHAVPPEVDENICQTMKDELLFEQYGGKVATDVEEEEPTDYSQKPDDSIPPLPASADSEEESEETASKRSDSYAVPEFVLAQRHLRVVDNWADQVKRAAKRGTEAFERQVLQRDGEVLIEAFERQAIRDSKKVPARAIGAKLSAEELRLRLKHFLEE